MTVSGGDSIMGIWWDTGCPTYLVPTCFLYLSPFLHKAPTSCFVVATSGSKTRAPDSMHWQVMFLALSHGLNF